MEQRTRDLIKDICEGSQKHLYQIQEYLDQRYLTDPILLEKFQLGYIPQIQTIYDILQEKNWSAKEALEIALSIKLLSQKDKKITRYGSAFNKRLIFPIFDSYGRYVGLSGRALTQERKPKYFNSVFNKGKHLYGLNFAKQSIIEQNFAIVVEGYMDVISANKIGIQNIVACMGTAFRLDHSILLSRYTNNIYILWDGDAAGQESKRKFLEHNKSPHPLLVKVFPKTLPNEFKDIDIMVNQNPSLAKKYLTNDIKLK